MRWRQTPRRRGLGPSGRAYGAKRGAGRRDEQRAKRTIYYSRWAAVSCHFTVTLGLQKDGTLWAWCHNYVGQLGLGDTTTGLTPTRVGTANDWASVSCGDGDTLAVKTNGTLWAWGFNGNGELGLGDTKERHTPAEVGSGSP